MSPARPLPLLVAVALLAVAVDPAPALPKRSPTRSRNVERDRDIESLRTRSIIVRRMPFTFYYPFSLWPLPKHQMEALEDSHETLQLRKTIEDMIKVGK